MTAPPRRQSVPGLQVDTQSESTVVGHLGAALRKVVFYGVWASNMRCFHFRRAQHSGDWVHVIHAIARPPNPLSLGPNLCSGLMWLYATDIISVASNYIILELPTVDVYNLLSTIKGAHSALKLRPPCSHVHPCAHTDARSHRVLVQASSRHIRRLLRHRRHHRRSRLHRLRRPLVRRRSANRPSSPPRLRTASGSVVQSTNTLRRPRCASAPFARVYLPSLAVLMRP